MVNATIGDSTYQVTINFTANQAWLATFCVLAPMAVFLFNGIKSYIFGGRKQFFTYDNSPHHESASQRVLYDAKETALYSSRKSAKRLASYPPGFPDGWYTLCFSDQLKVGEVKYYDVVGQELALYRGEDGVAKVIDAHCPHLGANIAIGGKVVGNNIECHFHRWQFDGKDGTCKEIPYCKPVPSVAKTKYWVTREYYGLVVFFYAGDEEKRLNPPYELDRVSQIDDGTHVYYGRREEYVHMHIQEVAENAADFMHFDTVHGQMTIPYTNIPIPFLRIQHEGRSEEVPDQPHILRFYDNASVTYNGKPLPKTTASAFVTYMGPASQVLFRFETEMGRLEIIQTHTPVEKLLQKVNFIYYADKSMPALVAHYIVGNWMSQWRNDVIIWENKVFRRRAILTKGDGNFSRLRKWYSQFYSEVSPTEEW